MQHDITQLWISLLLGVPAIVFILIKYNKTSIFFILASLLLGFDALLDISIGNGYAEEGIYATLSLISKELKNGNQELIIEALDDTDMSSSKNNKYDLWERIRFAKEQAGNEPIDPGGTSEKSKN